MKQTNIILNNNLFVFTFYNALSVRKIALRALTLSGVIKVRIAWIGAAV